MSNMWGFDLDMTAVRLMRRDNGNWQEVAAEKIEGADIEQRLMALADRVESDAPVELFLPRDQILYSDIEISSEDNAQADIEAALDGATPYVLDDLDLDWEMTGPTTARVAAIALETLDEAVAFAEVRGIKVGGFSSLAEPDDFPRFPNFTGHNIFLEEDTEDEEPAAPVAFTSARVESKPRPDAGTLTPVAPEAEPVVTVENDAPVMTIKAPATAPLDPGRPMAGPSTPPRVRTDIASRVVSQQAASLTPPAVKVRSGPAAWKIGAVFAAVFVLTVGVATLVWQYLPLGPGSNDIPVSEDTGAVIAAPETPPSDTERPEVDVALAPATPEIETSQETVPTPEPDVAQVSDLPLPVANIDVVLPKSPIADTAPQLTTLSSVDLVALPELKAAVGTGERLPFVDLGLPAEPAPTAIANILTVGPDLSSGPTDAAEDLTRNIYLGAIDPGELSFDAIALPRVSSFSASALPETGLPPLAIPDQTEPEVALDDNQPLVEEEAVASLDAPETAIETPLAEPEVAAPLATPDVPETEQQATGLPRPTELASNLTDRAPRARPTEFVAQIERQQFGGRTRAELAGYRPPPRPASAQALAEDATERAATELAIAASPLPRSRPQDFDAIVAVAIVQSQASRVTASLDYQTPNTNAAIEAALQPDAEVAAAPARAPAPAPARAVAPRVSIPSSASVSRQATVENAIRLNRVNLVGVYGSPADRRALIRLPSGRFVKVKVGDQVDGGTVAQITDDELLYQKGRRTLSLSIPKG
jgi:hypothetical protein